MIDDHGCTRSGGYDDRSICCVEHRDGVRRHRSCFVTVARVVRRLTAAGLVLRELDRDSLLLKHFDHRPPDLRIEGVDDAGDEELCRRRGSTHVDQR